MSLLTRTYLWAVPCAALAIACGSGPDESTPNTTSCGTCTGAAGADTCELPLAEVSNRCEGTFDEARAAACAVADGFEFQARYGVCGEHLVVWQAGFYSEGWCIYAPGGEELVGVIYSDDVPASCGAHTVEAGVVELDCAEPPTACVPG